ncbi:MAG TPA: hypothetical protein VKU02_29790 [Gemmataceae bacterium]|nr:hypothetical protein [Gemmataceae bacterium]
MSVANTKNRGGLRASVNFLLTHKSLPLLTALLAVVLAAPALGAGWILDDYYHRTVLLGTPQFQDLFGPPAEMFRFFRGDAERTARVMDLGFFPWWTYPGLKAEFCQVVTVWTHRLDYWLWPDSPILMHLHSLLWFGALVAAVGCLYREVFGPTLVAGLAAILFAIDDAHGTPAGFLANRNILIAGLFGVLALITHDAWRRKSWSWGAVLAPLLAGMSLFAKEEGIGTYAYLGAYALYLDPRGWRRGCVALAPSIVVLFAWRALRDHWGYGVRDMGLYVDPLTDPGPFAAALVERLPILLLGQWGFPPSDVAAILPPPARTVLWLGAVVFAAWLFVVAMPLLWTDRSARFWATGMLLALIPVSATFPMDRLLTLPSIGAFGLLAQILHVVFVEQKSKPLSRWWRVAAIPLGYCFVAIHLILAPLVLPFRAGNPTLPKGIEQTFYVRISLPKSVAHQTVVIVNAPSAAHAGLLPLLRVQNGAAPPRHTRVLGPGLSTDLIRRVDENTLLIRPTHGYLYWILDKVFRSDRRPLTVGEKVELSDMTAQVVALTDDGRPAEVSFHFSVPLEDPSLLWLCYRNNAFEPFTPPSVGESVEIKMPGLLRWRP